MTGFYVNGKKVKIRTHNDYIVVTSDVKAKAKGVRKGV